MRAPPAPLLLPLQQAPTPEFRPIRIAHGVRAGEPASFAPVPAGWPLFLPANPIGGQLLCGFGLPGRKERSRADPCPASGSTPRPERVRRHNWTRPVSLLVRAYHVPAALACAGG